MLDYRPKAKFKKEEVMKLHRKMTLTIIALMTVLVLVLSILFFQNWYQSMQRQVALDAMDQAMIIADNHAIKENMVIENGYIAVNKQVESISLKTRIQYLYIVNQEGRYFAHPIPALLNSQVKPQDIHVTTQAHQPAYYYDLSQNAVVEGYAPIYTDGQYSGDVIVGIYNGQILQSIRASAVYPLIFTLIFLGIASLAGHKLSQSIKADIYGLEPAEIALLLHQNEVIIDNMGEGLIGIDANRRIILVNTRVNTLIPNHGSLKGQLVEDTFLSDWVEDKWLKETTDDELTHLETEWRIGAGQILSVNLIKLSQMDHRLNLLIKLQDMSQVRKKAEALTNMEQLTQALRAQNHEFMNKLHTISGLIQLGEVDEALQFISTVSRSQQNFIKQLNEWIKVPVVSGLLLAKYSKAVEHKIKFELDEDSWLEKLPLQVQDEDLTSILGNLIDNAIEALSGQEEPVITVGIYEEEQMLFLEVKDNGKGFSGPVEAYLIEGVSSKGQNRGYGLAIVTQKIEAIGGYYQINNDEGACWQIQIPMEDI